MGPPRAASWAGESGMVTLERSQAPDGLGGSAELNNPATMVTTFGTATILLRLQVRGVKQVVFRGR